MITINYGFKINAKESIDVRLILSKADMLACSGARPKYLLPDLYFGLCTDDGYFYKYDVTATEDPETGKFRKIDYLTKVDKDELQAAIDAEVARATGIESGLDERIKNLEARGRFLSSWDCTTGKPETEPERKPYAYKSGDYYIISIVGVSPTVNYQPEPIQYTGAASTTVETRAVAPGDYYTYDGSKWVWVKNTQQTVTFRQIAGSPDDNTALKAVLDTIRASVTSETTRAVGVENSLGQQIQTERSRAIGAEDTLQANITAEATARSNIDGQLAKAIQDEYDRAIAAEEVLQGNIDAEATRAAGEETRIDTALQSEILRAKAEEEKLAADILSEQTERIAEIARVEKKIDDETTRAIGKENEIAQDLAAEITRATGVEAQLRTDLNAEVTRASTKETEIETALASEKLAREAADAELENKKLNVPSGVKDPEDPGKGGPYNISYAFDIAADAEKAVVTTHTVTLDNNFEEKKFSAAVPGATEATAGLMTAADKKSLNELPGKLATEIEERKAADLALQANIDAEAARAKAEEAKKVNKEVIGTNGKAEIFNEADGGGAKFTHNDGSEAFVGVNDGGQDGLMAQIYADKLVDGKWQGAKIDVTNEAMYYTVGNKSFAERAIPENEIATKKDVAGAGKVNDVKVDGVSVVDENKVANINDRASKQALADEEARAKAAEGTLQANIDNEASIRARVDTDLNNAIAQVALEKLNIPPKVDDPEDPGFGHPYNFTTGFGVTPAADKMTLVNKTITLDNVFTKMQFEAEIPGAIPPGVVPAYPDGVAGLMTAADKKKLDEVPTTYATKAELTEEVTRASEEETRIDTALQSEIARAQAEEAKKLNVPEGVKDPLDPWKGHPYNVSYAFDIEADAEKATVTTHTVTLDNTFTERKYSAAIPGATQVSAGLQTAADKIKVDHALQDTDTLILQCSYE